MRVNVSTPKVCESSFRLVYILCGRFFATGQQNSLPPAVLFNFLKLHFCANVTLV